MANIGPTLLVLASVGMLWWAYHAWQQIRATRTWQATDAAVEHAGVRFSGWYGYVLDVSYIYSVEGESYTGHRIYPGGLYGLSTRRYRWRREAVDALNELGVHPGGRLRVYVDPAAPQASAVVVETSVVDIAVTSVCGVSCLFFSVAMLLWPGPLE